MVSRPEAYPWSSYQTGSKKFVDQIEEKLNQRFECRGPGRPKKNK